MKKIYIENDYVCVQGFASLTDEKFYGSRENSRYP